MSILKSRRQFLIAAAAAGAAGIGGAYFLSRPSLSRMALAGTGPREGSVPKVAFLIVADGLGTEQFNGANGASRPGGLALWHPWDGVEGTSSWNNYNFDTENPLLARASAVLGPFSKRALFIRGTRVGKSSNAGHNGFTELLVDNNRTLPSIDQILGSKLIGGNPGLPLLFAGDIRHNKGNTVSWAAAGTAAAIEFNPKSLFSYAFPGVTRTATDAGGAHVFDPAMGELKELKEQLTATEQQKLETHLDSVEEMVANLENGGGAIGECNPTEPEMESSWLGDVKTRPKVLLGHSQVITAALSCGLTRVATLQIGATSEETTIFDADDKEVGNAHQCAHQTIGGGGDDNMHYWAEARFWYMRRVKDFLDQLSAYADPDSPSDTLLDHTLVVVTSELSDGLPEHQYDMPLVLIGGEKSFGTLTGNGNGRAINIRGQSENPQDQYQVYKDHVKIARIWHTIAAAAGVQSGYDAPDAAGERGCETVSKIFSGIA